MVSERIEMHNEYDTEKMSNDFSKSKSTKLHELSKPPKYLSNCTYHQGRKDSNIDTMLG